MLPKELRLEIYEYLYPALPSKSPVPLLPLSYALLRTSKQLHLECLPIYTACYHDYYSASKFALFLHGFSDPNPGIEQQINNISEKDFNRITDLTITVRPTSSGSPDPSNGSSGPSSGPTNSENDWTFTLVHPYGGWRITRPPGPPGKFIPGVASVEDGGRILTWRRFRPWTTRISPGSSETVVVPTKASWDYHAGEEKLIAACRRCGRSRGGGLRGHVLELDCVPGSWLFSTFRVRECQKMQITWVVGIDLPFSVVVSVVQDWGGTVYSSMFVCKIH
ncbi:hypothetical protein LTR95_006324 [Oleoguttula sp. CCFEE 5521]